MYRCIVVITSFIIFSSCANKSGSELIVFKAAEEGLQSSNKAIFNATNVLYQALEQKLLRPETAVQASIWQPKAILIKEKSSEITRYLDSLIIELKKEADLRMVDMKEVYNEGDLDAVSRLFTNKNTGEELYEKLQKYKKDMLAVDPQINNEFGKVVIITTKMFEIDENKEKDFTTYFFKNIPAISGITLLNKFANNARVLENQLVQYCFNKIGSMGWYLTKFSYMVTQSTTIIKAGDQMKIEAGVGEFSFSSKPTITINGKIFAPDYDNVTALYEFKTPAKAGKYSVPVKIEFINERGIKQKIERKVEYTVVE